MYLSNIKGNYHFGYYRFNFTLIHTICTLNDYFYNYDSFNKLVMVKGYCYVMAESQTLWNGSKRRTKTERKRERRSQQLTLKRWSLPNERLSLHAGYLATFICLARSVSKFGLFRSIQLRLITESREPWLIALLINYDGRTE